MARDPDGYTDLRRLYFLVNSTPTVPPASCHGFFDRGANAVYLCNDTLTTLQGPLTPGSSGTLQNSQYTIFGDRLAVVSAAGTDLALNLGAGRRGEFAAGLHIHLARRGRLHGSTATVFPGELRHRQRVWGLPRLL